MKDCVLCFVTCHYVCVFCVVGLFIFIVILVIA